MILAILSFSLQLSRYFKLLDKDGINRCCMSNVKSRYHIVNIRNIVKQWRDLRLRVKNSGRLNIWWVDENLYSF